MRSGLSPHVFAARWPRSFFLDQLDADAYELTQRSVFRLLVTIPGRGLRDRYRRLQILALYHTAGRDWADLLVPRFYAQFRRAFAELFPSKTLRALTSDRRHWRAFRYNRAYLHLLHLRRQFVSKTPSGLSSLFSRSRIHGGPTTWTFPSFVCKLVSPSTGPLVTAAGIAAGGPVSAHSNYLLAAAARYAAAGWWLVGW